MVGESHGLLRVRERDVRPPGGQLPSAFSARASAAASGIAKRPSYTSSPPSMFATGGSDSNTPYG